MNHRSPAPVASATRAARRPHIRFVLGLVALALLASGCSDEPALDAEQERARDVSQLFLTAVVDEDAEAACAVTALDGTVVSSEPEWEEACVAGIKESNTSDERRDTYAKQMKAGAVVSAVKDDRATVTWDEDGRAGADPTTHTLTRIDGDWYVTQ